MKTLAIMMMMLLFVAGTAYGVTYADTGTSKDDPSDLGPQNDDPDYLTQSGMLLDQAAPPPSDPIQEDSLVTGNCVDNSDDWDEFNWELDQDVVVTVNHQHGFMKITDAYNQGGSNVVYQFEGPATNSWTGTLGAGQYSLRVLAWSGGYAHGPWDITFDGDFAPPVSPIPEPAGLGLVGIALLGLRKRRS